jgi:predicted glutamine amidotransferase
MAGDLGFRHKAVMKNLLFFNTLRGKDSTGLTAYDNRKNEIDTRKMTCPGYDFIAQPWIDGLLHLCEGVWLGHGRFKTVGEVSRLNAHPFSVTDNKDLISLFGAHNGTLTNKHEIVKAVGENFGTDSEALLNLIDKVGPKEAIAQASGAWALTWWAAHDNAVHLLKNKERPLYYTFTDDMKVLVWASEAWMLRVACSREDVKLISNERQGEVIYALPDDTLFTFKLPSYKGNDDTFAMPEREGGLLGLPEKNNFWGGYNRQNWRNDNFWEETQQKAKEKRKEEGEAGINKKSKDTLVGFEGKVVDRQYVETLKSHGCDWCGGTIHDNNFAWLSEMDIVCHKCMRGEHFKIDIQEKKIISKVLSLVR